MRFYSPDSPDSLFTSGLLRRQDGKGESGESGE
jgi:hypothetical protein